MTPWTDAIYDFPDDQDASLTALLSALPARYARLLVGTPYGGYRLRGLSTTEQIYLKLAVDDLIYPEGCTILGPGELFVPNPRRAAVQAVLAATCSCQVKWTELQQVGGIPDALAAFDELWERHIFSRL